MRPLTRVVVTSNFSGPWTGKPSDRLRSTLTCDRIHSFTFSTGPESRVTGCTYMYSEYVTQLVLPTPCIVLGERLVSPFQANTEYWIWGVEAHLKLRVVHYAPSTYPLSVHVGAVLGHIRIVWPQCLCMCSSSGTPFMRKQDQSTVSSCIARYAMG